LISRAAIMRAEARQTRPHSLDLDQAATGAVGRAVRIGVVALLALLLLDGAVAAIGTERAVGVASVVSAYVLGFAEIALLSSSQNAIATDRVALAARSVKARERQLEGGTFGFAFGVEHLDFVDLACLEAQVRGAGHA